MRTYRYMADVSSNNGKIDIAAYSRAGHAVIAIKATQGDHYVNPFHLSQCQEAHRLGLTVVHYHYCSLGNVGSEIRNFRNTYLKGWRKGDYCCFDLEVPGLRIGTYAREILGTFFRKTGHPPILYTYKAYAEEHLKGLRVPGGRWWIAKYSNGAPTLPKGEVLWAWQYTDGQFGPEPHALAGIGHSDGSIVNVGVSSRLWIRKLRTRKRK